MIAPEEGSAHIKVISKENVLRRWVRHCSPVLMLGLNCYQSLTGARICNTDTTIDQVREVTHNNRNVILAKHTAMSNLSCL